MAMVDISQEDVGNWTRGVDNYRRSEFNANFPVLKREDYDSEDSYKAALLKQYEEIRMAEYEVICEDVGMNMAAASAYYSQEGVNQRLWKECETLNGPTAAQLKDHSGIDRVSNLARGVPDGSATCAITAGAIASEISAKFGYDGKDNVVSNRGNIANAAGIQTAVNTGHNGGIADKTTRNRVDLNQAIANGQVGPGTVLSYYSKGNAHGSMNHAKTVVSVERDDNGRPIKYTIMGNNSYELVTREIKYDQNGKALPGKDKVAYSATNLWAADKIGQERRALENKSTAEIEAAINKSRENVLGEDGFYAQLRVAEADLLKPQNSVPYADAVMGRKKYANRVKTETWRASYADRKMDVPNEWKMEILPSLQQSGAIETVNEALAESGLNPNPDELGDLGANIQAQEIQPDAVNSHSLTQEREKPRTKIRSFFYNTGQKIKGIFKKKNKEGAEADDVVGTDAEVLSGTAENEAEEPAAVETLVQTKNYENELTGEERVSETAANEAPSAIEEHTEEAALSEDELSQQVPHMANEAREGAPEIVLEASSQEEAAVPPATAENEAEASAPATAENEAEAPAPATAENEAEAPVTESLRTEMKNDSKNANNGLFQALSSSNDEWIIEFMNLMCQVYTGKTVSELQQAKSMDERVDAHQADSNTQTHTAENEQAGQQNAGNENAQAGNEDNQPAPPPLAVSHETPNGKFIPNGSEPSISLAQLIAARNKLTR